jgi:ribosomal protein S27AE
MGRYWKKPELKKPEKIKRSCLKCGATFIAEGRFKRICPKCTSINRAIALGSHDPGSVGGRTGGYYGS